MGHFAFVFAAIIYLAAFPYSSAFSPFSNVAATSRCMEHLLRAATDENDTTEIPFFLRGEEEEDTSSPPSVASSPYQPVSPNVGELVSKTTEITKELTSGVVEQVNKIDWDEVKSNVEAIATSEEVKTLRKASADILGATFSALKDTATNVIENQQKQQQQQSEAANALLEATEGSVSIKEDEALQAILREAEEALEFAGAEDDDNDDKSTESTAKAASSDEGSSSSSSNIDVDLSSNI